MSFKGKRIWIVLILASVCGAALAQAMWLQNEKIARLENDLIKLQDRFQYVERFYEP